MKGLGRGVLAILAIYPLAALAIPVPVPAPAVPTPSVPAPSIPVPSPFVTAPGVPAPQVPVPVPAPGLIPVPAPGLVPVPGPGLVPVPGPGHIPVPSPGHIPVPSPGHIPVPSPGHIPVPSPYLLSQTQLLSNANLPVLAMDGSHQKGSKTLPNQCFNEMNRAGVKCCSYGGEQCVSPCRTENEIMSFEVAALLCIDIGMHMCSNEELTGLASCAHGGCPYDGEYVWTSSACSESTTSKKHPKILSLHKSTDLKRRLPALRLRKLAGADSDVSEDDLSVEEQRVALADAAGKEKSVEKKKGSNMVTPSRGVVTYGCPRTQSAQSKIGGTNLSNVKHLDVKTDVAGARCCTFDSMMCTSLCHSPMEKMVRAEAEQRCADVGGRLCTRAELTSSICCESRCGYDTEFVWTSQLVQ